MRKKISLQEALCGFNMNIKTLQKEARFVPITTEPGQVIQDKMLYRIPNEGKCSKKIDRVMFKIQPKWHFVT